MAAKVITSFLPDLVTAVSDCVQSVSDQCLAKGLIPDAVYKRVLESGATSEDKARTLVLAVKKSTETDESCFELFMNALEKELPLAIKNSVVLPMRKAFSEKASQGKSVVPYCAHHGRATYTPYQRLAFPATIGEIMKQHTCVAGKTEDAIRQHERACAEKAALEETIQAKEKENEILKAELKKNQCVHGDVDSTVRLAKLESILDRISTCEAELSKLSGEVKELQSIIEEQGMLVKRRKNIAGLGFVNLSQLVWKEIQDAKEMVEKKVQLLLETKTRNAKI